jgi:hypothetical protein
MIRRAAVAAAFIAFAALPLRADFDSLVRAVETIPGLHRVPMPGFGLVRFAVWMIHPKGVYDFQLATFEGKGGDIDPRALERLVRTHAEAGYQPLVVAHSRRDGELTLIWARPSGGDKVELLLLTHDPHDETVVLRTVVDVDMIAREIDQPRTASRIARQQSSAGSQ